jgi:hypothetical protein
MKVRACDLAFGLGVQRVLVRACHDVDRSGKECFKRLPAAFKNRLSRLLGRSP